VNTDTS